MEVCAGFLSWQEWRVRESHPAVVAYEASMGTGPPAMKSVSWVADSEPHPETHGRSGWFAKNSRTMINSLSSNRSR